VEVPSTKFQDPGKFETPMTKNAGLYKTTRRLIRASGFVIISDFVIWAMRSAEKLDPLTSNNGMRGF
jgi:hypothetical protein